MAGKKTGKRLLTWVLVLVMALSLLPLNVLAANGPETDSSSGMNFTKELAPNQPDDGNYTIRMTAQATGKEVETTKPVPMDIVLVLDQSGSMADDFNGNSTSNNEARRQYAMKAAVNSFIGEVAGKYSNEADHRMAIVTFDSDAETLARWTAVDKDGGASELTGKISALSNTPSGATNVGAGMELAQTLMDNDAYTGDNTDRQKTVIVFTDGVPTTESDFDTDVANNAISAAKSMKGSGVTIYTVGIFNGAKPTELYGKDKIGFLGSDQGECSGEKGDYCQYRKGLLSGGDIQEADIAAGNRFLNYLSSNYDANKIGVSRYEKDHLFAYYIGFEITDNPAKGSNQGYYKTAADASSLEKIFKKISNTVPEPVNSKLDDKTVITDTLSNYFTFAGTEEDVKVYAEKSDGTQRNIGLPAGPNGIDVNNKTVTVTGYDFSKHYQGIGGEDEETLVIEIKVKPDTSYTNWGASGEYKTNEGNATVTHPNNEEPIAEAESPKAPVDTYSVEYALYALGNNNNASWPNNPPATLYYLQGAAVPVTNSVPTLEGYEFTGWKSDIKDDDTVYTSNGTNSSITMPAANVTLTAQWTANKYKLSYETNSGTISENANYTKAGEVAFGTKLDTPAAADMTREGYTFEGWYSDAGLNTPAPDTMPANDLTLHAKWEKNPVGDGTFDFNDVFHDGKNTPAITKTVKGNVGRNFKETFKVAVEPKSENAIDTMSSARYTGKAEVIASKSLKDVPFLFKPEVVVNASVPYGQLLFTKAGIYTYTVREELPGQTSRMSYDTTEYTLKINVVLDEDSNTYQVESWQFAAGNRPYPAPLNIVNTYRAYHPSTPSKPTLNTGDHYAYVMGYPDGTVRPNGSITRAEVSAILFRLLSDKTRDEYFTTESSFTDVKAGAWYNNSIATLEKAGVIVDTAKGGAFRPNEAITRAELAAMLAQFSDAKPVKGVKFSDVSAGHWAYEAIAIAAKMGWIEGYPDGTFRPDATITRAEMMTLVNRALERVPSDEDHLLSKRVMLTFPDCKSGDWFYIAVQEATNSHTYERAATEKNGDEQWTALRANRDWTLLEK